MTELIDELQPGTPKGRTKALTLLILTSIGTAAKLLLAVVAWFLVLTDAGIQRLHSDDKFIFLTITAVGLCGILNFAGSLMMFRRNRLGIWIYVIGQLATPVIVTWCVLGVSYKLYEEQQLFLLVAYAITIIYIILYLTNSKYYSRHPITEELEF